MAEAETIVTHMSNFLYESPSLERVKRNGLALQALHRSNAGLAKVWADFRVS